MTQGQRSGSSMWDWPKGKVALEALFLEGQVTTAHRPNFTRMYDLSERVIPDEHFGAKGLEREEAQSDPPPQAARSMGVATAADLADYPEIRMPEARPLIERLSERGGAGRGRGRGLGADRVSPSRGPAAAESGGTSPALAVRQPGVVPGPDRAALGLSLPDRDLRPGAEACLWLLRAPVPPRRRPGGTRRPQDRPQERDHSWSRASLPSRVSIGHGWPASFGRNWS